VTRKSPLLCCIRYRIFCVRYITLRESTHNSIFCAKNVILRAEVHIAQEFAQISARALSIAEKLSWLISRAVMAPLNQHKQACTAFSSTWFNTIHFPVTDLSTSFAFCGRSFMRLLSTSRILRVLALLALLALRMFTFYAGFRFNRLGS
jgi:hypothetical protein